MSLHSYTRCWCHLIWGTENRQKLLTPAHRPRLAEFLQRYAHAKNIPIRVLHVNADHVHVLIDQPPEVPLTEITKLLKGASSHWVNRERLIATRFAWARGYGAFSVSESNVAKVVQYIENQEEHHRTKTFGEEYEKFLTAHGINLRGENR
ncbi:MAG: IS200/IS605 family transposase [candidate division Zixibacteria bacterium]|nr:IS200/IS605 family transposase [candidate division Zixibacteria bacterium]